MKKILYTPENINGTLVDYTAEEIELNNLDVANEIKIKEAYKAQAITTANKKASGKQKLKDLGLDDDEIQAIMGI
tara:strand:+ start:103 stop:327 length:225 start_codon:yes stop_codon:yes gene_type:complete